LLVNNNTIAIQQKHSETNVKSSIEFPTTTAANKSTLTNKQKPLHQSTVSGYTMCSPTFRKQDHIQKSSNKYGRVATDISDESSKDTIPQNNETTAHFTSSLKAFLLVAFISVAIMEFSLWFPFVIPGVASAAVKTYEPAWYKYDVDHTEFDNTAWTYGTDYLLTVVMAVLAIKCLMASAPDDCPKKNRASLRLRRYSASLLICYGLSTLAGAWAHQHFTSIDSLNTMRFRVLWYLCVGNVSFASCYMGLIGREVQQVFGVQGVVPLGPWWFWPAYGSYMAAACGLGYISFKRPACDIFIAGITQFPSTFYCLATLGLRKWPSSKTVGDSTSKESPIGLVRLSYRIMFYIGFIGNAPLLPMYPLLVQYSGLSLAGINTILHSWLMIMWGLQGISLLHLCKAMSSYKPKASKD